MESDNKNTDKNKETPSKIEQEINDALNSESEFEPILDPELSPLNEPVEEILPIKNEAYFMELCNWLSNGYQQLFHKTPAKRDYLIRYYFFPPEQFPEPGDVQKQTWKPISEAALKLKPEPARQRIFHKSPQHHVFLISILEAISRDTEKFIEIYVAHTNKTLELKYAGGIQKCLELLIGELRTYIERNNTQLLPVLYHNKDHGLMMLENGYELNDNEDQLVFEFGFSKITSDNFVKQLIKSLEVKLTSLDSSLVDKETSKNPNEEHDNKKRININGDIISNLFEILKMYFDEKDHNNLDKLLKGEKISKVLLFESNGIKLVDVFFRLKENGKIINSKVDIQRWICDNFKFLERNKVVKPFKGYYVKKIMTGQTLISKSSRISFKALHLS